jgi:hypothetical protein
MAEDPSSVGQQSFTDGIEREVFEDGNGRQFVLDDAGEPVYGQWLPPVNEPYIVGSEAGS